jgi:hypothetical protein
MASSKVLGEETVNNAAQTGGSGETKPSGS